MLLTSVFRRSSHVISNGRDARAIQLGGLSDLFRNCAHAMFSEGGRRAFRRSVALFPLVARRASLRRRAVAPVYNRAEVLDRRRMKQRKRDATARFVRMVNRHGEEIHLGARPGHHVFAGACLRQARPYPWFGATSFSPDISPARIGLSTIRVK